MPYCYRVLSQLKTNFTTNTDTFLRKIVLDSQSADTSIPVALS